MGVGLTPGSGGDTVATETISGEEFQHVKLAYGPLTVATLVSSNDPLPVTEDTSNGTQNLILARYLDTTGDGTGTKNGNLDGSSVQKILRLAPASGDIYRIARIVISVGDSNGCAAADFGNITGGITNGIQIRVHNGVSTVVDLTDGVPIKTNSQWAALMYDSDMKTWGTSDELLACRWTFTKFGQYMRLDGTAGEELQILIDDDLTALDSFYINAQGYEEGTPT